MKCNGLRVGGLAAKSCPTLWDTVNCSPQGSFAHRISQTRILEWVAISFSRGSSWPSDQTLVFCTAGRFFTAWATREAQWTQEENWNVTESSPKTTWHHWLHGSMSSHLHSMMLNFLIQKSIEATLSLDRDISCLSHVYLMTRVLLLL